MTVHIAAHIQGTSYSLDDVPLGKGLTIRRHDPDHPRTVAFVETEAQWRRFVQALEDGLTEPNAVLAIDQ